MQKLKQKKKWKDVGGGGSNIDTHSQFMWTNARINTDEKEMYMYCFLLIMKSEV